MSIFNAMAGFFSLQGFSPERQDNSIPLYRRMGSKPLAYVAHGPGGFIVATLRLRENALPSVVVHAQSTDTASLEDVLGIAKKRCGSGLLALSLADVAPAPIPLNSVTRIPARELAIRLAAKPTEILGHQYVSGQRYSGFFHREMSQGIFASHGVSSLAEAELLATTLKFTTVRTQVSLIPLLDILLADKRLGAKTHHPVVIDHGVATYIPIGSAGEWLDVRSRRFIGEAQPLDSFLKEIAETTEARLLILSSGCNGNTDISKALKEVPNHDLYTLPNVPDITLSAVASSLN